jgi:hypothetical protein
MEAQTLFLEGQAAVCKQFTNFAWKVAHQALVVDAMHAAGQNAVVMCYQLDIAAVEASDFIETVREPDTGLKMLLEIRETAGKRRAPGTAGRAGIASDRPMYRKLFGILSTKRASPVCRYIRVASRYRSASAATSATFSAASASRNPASSISPPLRPNPRAIDVISASSRVASTSE